MLQYFEVGQRIVLSNRNGIVSTASLLTIISTKPHVAAYRFVFAQIGHGYRLS